MHDKSYVIVTTTLTERDDGGLSVSSDDLPGLILSGSDRAGIMAAIAPAIRTLFEHRGFQNVGVHHGVPAAQIVSGQVTRSVEIEVAHESPIVRTEQFVVELAA